MDFLFPKYQMKERLLPKVMLYLHIFYLCMTSKNKQMLSVQSLRCLSVGDCDGSSTDSQSSPRHS